MLLDDISLRGIIFRLEGAEEFKSEEEEEEDSVG
jgi:hypothetical protein